MRERLDHLVVYSLGLAFSEKVERNYPIGLLWVIA